jgi:hypothetical protein
MGVQGKSPFIVFFHHLISNPINITAVDHDTLIAFPQICFF